MAELVRDANDLVADGGSHAAKRKREYESYSWRSHHSSVFDGDEQQLLGRHISGFYDIDFYDVKCHNIELHDGDGWRRYQ
jgi:hypothetical protein